MPVVATKKGRLDSLFPLTLPRTHSRPLCVPQAFQPVASCSQAIFSPLFPHPLSAMAVWHNALFSDVVAGRVGRDPIAATAAPVVVAAVGTKSSAKAAKRTGAKKSTKKGAKKGKTTTPTPAAADAQDPAPPAPAEQPSEEAQATPPTPPPLDTTAEDVADDHLSEAGSAAQRAPASPITVASEASGYENDVVAGAIHRAMVAAFVAPMTDGETPVLWLERGLRGITTQFRLLPSSEEDIFSRSPRERGQTGPFVVRGSVLDEPVHILLDAGVVINMFALRVADRFQGSTKVALPTRDNIPLPDA